MAFVQAAEISAGTTLAQLAWEAYESNTAWRDIADANGLAIFEQLPVGRLITLPEKSTITEVVAAASDLLQGLDLSSLKQPEVMGDYSLFSWVI
jgi:hypothetical protein